MFMISTASGNAASPHHWVLAVAATKNFVSNNLCGRIHASTVPADSKGIRPAAWTLARFEARLLEATVGCLPQAPASLSWPQSRRNSCVEALRILWQY